MQYLINGYCKYIFNLFGVPSDKYNLLDLKSSDFVHKKEIDFFGTKKPVYAVDFVSGDFVLSVKLVNCSSDSEEYVCTLSTKEINFGFFMNQEENIFLCCNLNNNVFEYSTIQQLSMLVNSLEKLRHCYSQLSVNKNDGDYDQLLDYIDHFFNIIEG